MFLNLDAVLLKLCGPFIDGSSPVFWSKVDWRYVVLGDRLDFKEVCGGGGRRYQHQILQCMWFTCRI